MRTVRGWACLPVVGLLLLLLLLLVAAHAQMQTGVNMTALQIITEGLCDQVHCDVEVGERGPSESANVSAATDVQDDDMCLCPESNQRTCVCVEYFTCINGEVDTTAAADGIVTLSTRIDEKLRSNCTERTQVCCELKINRDDPPVPKQPVKPVKPGPPQSQPLQVQGVPAQSFQAPPVKPQKSGCGQYAKQGIGLHANAVFRKGEASPGEFPWMVAILRKDARTKRLKKDPYWCGGALLGPNVVLTAAHCVRNSPLEELSIVAGAWNRTSKTDAFEQQEIGVKEKVLHPQHDNGNQRNDIALLILATPVRPVRHISYACLATSEQAILVSNEECLLSGWGLPESQTTAFSDVLRKTSASIIPSEGDCHKKIVSVPGINKEYKIDESHICAAGAPNAITACQGDGGSPLVCPLLDTEETYFVRGLASWGPEACSSTPSLYTNIAMFRSWVDSELQKLNIGTDTYTYSVN